MDSAADLFAYHVRFTDLLHLDISVLLGLHAGTTVTVECNREQSSSRGDDLHSNKASTMSTNNVL
jgi:hypothetical protein